MGSTFGFLLKPFHLGYSRPLPIRPFIFRNFNNTSKSISFAISEDNLMSAIYYDKHGTSSVLKFAENCFSKPIPIHGQLLIRILSFSINPCDIKLRSTNMNKFMLPLPKIPGTDICGEVIDNSQSETNKFNLGDKVICMMPILYSNWGASAEYCAIDENLLVKAPKNLQSKVSSALPLVGLTVIQAFSNFLKRNKGNTEGKIVLIQAGAGGLGTFAIQYCKNVLKMLVITTSSTNNIQFLKNLGADQVIDYTTECIELKVQDVDVVFDSKSYIYENITFQNGIIKNDGTYINIASSPNKVENINSWFLPEANPWKVMQGYSYDLFSKIKILFGYPCINYDYIFVKHNKKNLLDVVKYVEEGKIIPIIDSVYPFTLNGIISAHEKIESAHTRGKIIVNVYED